jgi:hypothetical protein
MLRYNNGEPFSLSVTTYLDSIGSMHLGNKIYISAQFDTLPKTLAIVDTGAPWCVLPRKKAEALNPNYLNEATEIKKLTIRGETEKGALIRLPITIYAEEGEDVTIEGTVFVPDNEREIPDFIGLDGFLSRIRFAVDPQNCSFFFGRIEE